jgi:putative MATE family efflux protein
VNGRPGGQRDLTTGPIARTLLVFALPTLGANVLQSLNGSVNSIWVGNFLGEQALAATSNANLVMFLMFSAIFGLAMATTIMVGQDMGRHNVEAARRALGSALALILALATLTAVLGWLFTPALLHALATPVDAQPLAIAYLRVIFLLMPFSFLTVLLTSAMRGMGDSVTPFWIMVLTVILDAGLNPLFILGWGPVPRMGIAGSAVATLIGSMIALVALIALIYKRDLPIRLRGAEWRYLKPDPTLLKTIVVKGVPMSLSMIVLSASMLVMIGLVNRQGVATTAAFGVTSQLWSYIQMPALAIGAAVSAMAAQNIGAGKWDRVERIAWSGAGINVLLTGTMILVITLVDRWLLGLFLTPDSPALPIAMHIHKLVAWSFVLFGVSMVLSSTMRANGAVMVPLLILFIACFPVRVGFAEFAQGWLGSDALWWAFSATSIASLIMTYLYFRYGKWRQAHLTTDAPTDTPEVMV